MLGTRRTGNSMISYGQRAAACTKAVQCSFRATIRVPAATSPATMTSNRLPSPASASVFTWSSMRAGPGVAGGGGGREGEGGDRPVGVVERDPDPLATVLEAVDLLDPGGGRKDGGAVGPRLQHGPDPPGGQARERGLVVGGEADHFAASGGRAPRHATRLGRPGRLEWRRLRLPAGGRRS